MRHLVKGRKLKRTDSHRKALMKNLATSLFEHKAIKTTEAKAKELRPYAERLITKARIALKREQSGQLPAGQTIDIHSRRIVGRFIRSKAVLQELFDAIAPACEERNGGYTRIIKTGFRRGDGGREAIIELVDFAAPQDGSVGLKKRNKARSQKKDNTPKAAPAVKTAPVVEAAPVQEVVPPAEEVVDEVVSAPVEEISEESTPAEEENKD